MSWIEKINILEKEPKVLSKKEKVSKLKVNLDTRKKSWEFAKNISGINLEKANYLARIDDVSKICNNHKEEFLKGCSEKFDLHLLYLA